MSPSRRVSNGRSPLVRKQCQITSFFSPGNSPVPNSIPNPSSGVSSSTSSLHDKAKQKKRPLVIIPPSVSSLDASDSAGEKAAYSSEVVGKRIRVFWPLDKAWYEGHVRSFDEASGKHVIQYDDAEEESLELVKEEIEWVEAERPRNLRRLRRISGSMSSAVNSPLESGKAEVEEGSSKEASSDDDEWGRESRRDVTEDDSEDVELESEDDLEDGVEERLRRSVASSSSKLSLRQGKRRKIAAEKMGCIRTVKMDDREENTDSKTPVGAGRNNFTHHANSCGKDRLLDVLDCSLTDDAAGRFGKRHAEKFKFLGAERKDAHRRRPGDAGYDPKTIYLPQEFLKSLSGGQRQWWEFKSKHMDKVLFFKMGKFYELFEMDAHIAAKELDLQYMKGEQPHCGFPEKNYSMNLEKLAVKGYRVLVIEQIETPEQLEIRRKEMGSKDKVVKREICAVVTKGTLVEGETLLANPDASYLMSITEKCQNFDEQNTQGTVLGICVVDVSTSKFMLGQFDDNVERDCLCSILSELRPVEIIKPFKVLSPVTERVLMHNTRNPLLNDLVPTSEYWNVDKTISEIKKIYSAHSGNSGTMDDTDGAHSLGNNPEILPCILSELDSAGENGSFALSALGGCLFYLRQAFLDETLLKCAKFEALQYAGSFNQIQKSYMILDAPALENLEILENRNGNPTGTLYAQLDNCVTGFGKRLLKRWLVKPLHNTSSIVARQDAVSGFKGAGLVFALEFRKMLSKLPDMERLLARHFASCVTFGRNASAIILYEDAVRKKLTEFLGVLQGCQLMVQSFSSLATLLTITESRLIHYLLTAGKGFPDVSKILKFFKDAFDWSEAEKSGRIIPHEGCDADYDGVCKTIIDIECVLMKHLKEQRKLLGNSSINYVTVGKDTYLLEVPESLINAIPHNYELRSSKKVCELNYILALRSSEKGFFRYWTADIKKYISELSRAEAEKESKLHGILLKLMQQFSEHHSKWRQLVSVVAELDVLISLSIASDYYDGPTCRPIINEIKDSDESITPFLFAKNLGHPTLRTDALGDRSFVPNDVTIGGNEHASFILLTGPNMGGKSTLLRQVCMSIILAQIGADVPAESFELSPVDRIFVRMGARDHIITGQSTFLTELSETASVLSSATRHSFVALDELGRGTSTSDGQAIAGSVLQYLVHETKCRGMFSTHYHRLAADFVKNPKVSVCHMACKVGNGLDGMEEVTFLYRLTPGSCPKSYGVNVARLAGVPSSVLQKAVEKSNDFEGAFDNRQHGRSALKQIEISVILDLIHVAETWKHGMNSQAFTMSLLREIQQKAQLLLVES